MSVQKDRALGNPVGKKQSASEGEVSDGTALPTFEPGLLILRNCEKTHFRYVIRYKRFCLRAAFLN